MYTGRQHRHHVILVGRCWRGSDSWLFLVKVFWLLCHIACHTIHLLHLSHLSAKRMDGYANIMVKYPKNWQSLAQRFVRFQLPFFFYMLVRGFQRFTVVWTCSQSFAFPVLFSSLISSFFFHFYRKHEYLSARCPCRAFAITLNSGFLVGKRRGNTPIHKMDINRNRFLPLYFAFVASDLCVAHLFGL